MAIVRCLRYMVKKKKSCLIDRNIHSLYNRNIPAGVSSGATIPRRYKTIQTERLNQMVPKDNRGNDPHVWEQLSHEERNHQLYIQQKSLLDQFLKTGAITQEQHDKSLHDLKEQMHEE